jgi:hypothetical protein
VFATSTQPWPEQPPLEAGETMHVTVDVENRFQSGRYHLGCSLLSGSAGLEIAALANRHKSFVVYGGNHVYGLVALEHEMRLSREGSA